MILSFHPCIQAEANVIVAGRPPGAQEEALIRRAEAVILPQGVRPDLYALCRRHCRRVFPDYDLRFSHQGKIGAIRLFRKFGIAHPESIIFSSVLDYCRRFPPERDSVPFPPPFVLKGNISGEGKMVFKIHERRQLLEVLGQFARTKTSGTRGFIAQKWISHGGRDLRVIVLYDRLLSYWRVQPDPEQFRNSLSAGGIIDAVAAPDLRRKAEALVGRFCRQTGINLAGFDIMFDERDHSGQPLMLEINYWFGRRFFGSSQAYYPELKRAIQRWLAVFHKEWPDRIRNV